MSKLRRADKLTVSNSENRTKSSSVRAIMKSRYYSCFYSVWIFLGLWTNPAVGQGPVIEVQAVAHKKATLPCNINPPDLSDSTILVLWYKDLGDMPIYSYDGRSLPGNHAKNEALLGQRAFFRTQKEPTVLLIDTVSESDAGLYRCRVDFLKSPTRNSRVNLTVIVPPQKPTIFDGSGTELVGIAGPYNEGSSISLTCVATGGKPPPKVTWWRGGSLLDDTYRPITGDGTVNNRLDISSLSRSDLHAVFTCQANNNNMSEPVTSSVKVEMYFRPLEVTFQGSNQPFSALKEVEASCQSVGSRPPAVISWYKDGQHLEASKVEVSPMGNVTISRLIFTPRVGDHGKSLVCRAENPRLEGSAIEDSWKLAVFFVPILNLALGSNLDPEDIREGGDVYFECKIHANPWVYKVVWLHNGLVVQHNSSAGIIMSNQSLVLQKVKRSSGGNYVCTATNIEGEGRSNPVELKVMYKPVCKTDQKRIYGVAKGEQVEIECKVDSNPKADNFKWAFNNSAEVMEVPQSRFSSDGSVKPATSSSILSYTPMTELDYGSVICFGSNVIGQQVEPCVFHIIAAGKPDPPFNCSVQNITSESMEVDCVEAFDGGLPQLFHVEVVDYGSPRLVSNLTSPIPFFVVTGLKPGQSVRLFVYAANRKGASDKIILEGQTIQEAEKRTVSLISAASQVEFELTPVLGVCVGVVCGLFLVALGIVLALRFRTDSRHSPALKATKTEYRVEDSEGDEKNPDIIPSSKEPEYFYSKEPVMYSGPKRNGSITENFRNVTYFSDKSTAEITYAELCLDNTGNSSGSNAVVTPSGLTWSSSTVDRKRRRNPLEESPSQQVIYATIDHSRRTNGEPAALHHHTQQLHHHHSHLPPGHHQQREIVSVRTPLLVSSQQESCV